MKQGIQEFHRKYVLVPADKAANNVFVVCRLHFVNTLKQELAGTRAYLQTDTDEVSVVNAHLNDLPVKFSVCVNEGQDKLPTMYWLPKLHTRPYKGTSRQRSGRGAIRKRFPLQKTEVGKNQTNNQALIP